LAERHNPACADTAVAKKSDWRGFYSNACQHNVRASVNKPPCARQLTPESPVEASDSS